MRTFVAGFASLMLLLAAGVCFAAPEIPNLVGTWTVKAEGAVFAKGTAPGSKTHHAGDFSTLTAEAVVTAQQGRVVRGTFKSARATENFVAVIGFDNKSFFYADEDGASDGRIVSKDRIDVVYRHVTAHDTVVGIGTWTRKK
jgi:hypothetical protein